MLLATLILALLISCEDTKTTTHKFGISNQSSNRNIKLSYFTVTDSNLQSVLVDSLYNGKYPLLEWHVKGDKEALSLEGIDKFFIHFVVFDSNDTFALKPNTRDWKYSYGGEDSGFKVHYYSLKISDQDLQ